MADINGPAGIIAPTPGDHEGESGHIDTRMISQVMLEYHEEVHVLTRRTAVMEFSNPDIILHKHKKPFAESAWPMRLVGSFIYQLLYSITILENKNIELLIFGGGGFPLPAIISRVLGVIVVFRVGGVKYKENDINTPNQLVWAKFLKLMRQIQYLLADKIIVISPKLAEFAETGMFQYKTESWNHYYFDLDLFDKRVNLLERDWVIGHVGISEIKGTDRLYESTRQLDKNISVLVLGEGEIHTDPAENIHVDKPGIVPREAMPHYYNEMKIFVVSSRSEGVPKAALEALACGTPVLTAPVGGLPDYIDDGVNGYILEDVNPDSIAKRINNLKSDGITESVSNSARDTVEDTLTFDATAKEYKRVILNYPERENT